MQSADWASQYVADERRLNGRREPVVSLPSGIVVQHIIRVRNAVAALPQNRRLS